MRRLAVVALTCLLFLLMLVRVEGQSHEVYLPAVRVNRPRQHCAGMTVGDCTAVVALDLECTRGWQLDPMVCPGVEAVSQVSSLAQIGRPLGGNSKVVLLLNEPENPKQNYVPDPKVAARGLVQMLDTYPTYDIGLPSASENYLDKMLLAAGSLPVERLIITGHCYGWGSLETALTKCKAHADALLDFAAKWGITRAWITEFALDPTWDGGMAASEQFVQQMPEYYKHAGIDRWFVFQVNSTEGRWSTGEMGLWVDNKITALGAAYRR